MRVDLKAENILIDIADNIKIIDFGLSNIMQPGKFFTSFCGSPMYESPEMILQTSYAGPGADIWSLGVLLFAMVTGYYPWQGDTLAEQLRKASVGAFIVPPFVSSG